MILCTHTNLAVKIVHLTLDFREDDVTKKKNPLRLNTFFFLGCRPTPGKIDHAWIWLQWTQIVDTYPGFSRTCSPFSKAPTHAPTQFSPVGLNLSYCSEEHRLVAYRSTRPHRPSSRGEKSQNPSRIHARSPARLARSLDPVQLSNTLSAYALDVELNMQISNVLLWIVRRKPLGKEKNFPAAAC